MKKLFDEFKTFISRGNVINLAVGVIIGSAFTAIVNAFVTNIITPLIALLVQTLTGRKDFSGMLFKVGNVEFLYGNLISATINFLLTAIVLFLIVKAVNRLVQKQPEEELPANPDFICPLCRSIVDKEAVKCPSCTADMTPLEID